MTAPQVEGVETEWESYFSHKDPKLDAFARVESSKALHKSQRRASWSAPGQNEPQVHNGAHLRTPFQMEGSEVDMPVENVERPTSRVAPISEKLSPLLIHIGGGSENSAADDFLYSPQVSSETVQDDWISLRRFPSSRASNAFGSRRISGDNYDIEAVEAARMRIRQAAWEVVDAHQKIELASCGSLRRDNSFPDLTLEQTSSIRSATGSKQPVQFPGNDKRKRWSLRSWGLFKSNA